MEKENIENLDSEIENNEEQEAEAPASEEAEVEEQALTQEEIQELRRRADASSKNFERLKKEEEARKTLESKIETLEAKLAASDTDIYSDDDDDVKGKIAELTAKLNQIQDKSDMENVQTLYPVLKDKRSEFEEFREEYPGIALDKVAKLFMSEKGLLETPPKRKGLEKAGGGTRTIPTSGQMSSDDVKRLRETNFKEYKKLLQAGKIKIS